MSLEILGQKHGGNYMNNPRFFLLVAELYEKYGAIFEGAEKQEMLDRHLEETEEFKRRIGKFGFKI